MLPFYIKHILVFPVNYMKTLENNYNKNTKKKILQRNKIQRVASGVLEEVSEEVHCMICPPAPLITGGGHVGRRVWMTEVDRAELEG